MRKGLRTIALASLALVAAFGAAWPLPQRVRSIRAWLRWKSNMMERSAEIALARSAAPASVSRDATVMVMGRHGYETAATGKTGFVCIVQRSWTAGKRPALFLKFQNCGRRSASMRRLLLATYRRRSRRPSGCWRGGRRRRCLSN